MWMSWKLRAKSQLANLSQCLCFCPSLLFMPTMISRGPFESVLDLLRRSVFTSHQEDREQEYIRAHVVDRFIEIDPFYLIIVALQRTAAFSSPDSYVSHSRATNA